MPRAYLKYWNNLTDIIYSCSFERIKYEYVSALTRIIFIILFLKLIVLDPFTITLFFGDVIPSNLELINSFANEINYEERTIKYIIINAVFFFINVQLINNNIYNNLFNVLLNKHE